jgi:catechol 2,3-dioxygenase
MAEGAARAYIPYSSRTGPKMADGTTKIVPAAPAEAVTPSGINHLVINVRDIDESHHFWTEILGFKEVGRSSRRNMRFYSGNHDGLMNHHDIALVENKELPAPPAGWAMFGAPVAINHIAITMPNREAWLKQLAFLRQQGVKFQRRINHGMTHSLYISDPNGYGVEVLYELPREVWGDNIQGALDYAEGLPTEGDAAFADDTDYPTFGPPQAPAAT